MTTMPINDWLAQQDQDKVDQVKTQMREQSAGGVRNWMDIAGGDENYAVWMFLADRVCARKIGLGIFDLSDWTWADAYAGGMRPAEAVREALENDDTFSMFMRGGE